jgi:hypothetical protein
VVQIKADRVCYLLGQPEKAGSAALKRTAVMAMVTHRTQDQTTDVVRFVEGYTLNEQDDVILEVGKDKFFALFAKDDTAWARTSDIDKQIVAALAKEKTAVVKASAKKDHGTVDTYSLAGFAQALALIDKACDVKR